MYFIVSHPLYLKIMTEFQYHFYLLIKLSDFCCKSWWDICGLYNSCQVNFLMTMTMCILQILQQTVLCQVYFTHPSYQILLILVLTQVDVLQITTNLLYWLLSLNHCLPTYFNLEAWSPLTKFHFLRELQFPGYETDSRELVHARWNLGPP